MRCGRGKLCLPQEYVCDPCGKKRAVNEKKLIISVAAYLTQALGQTFLQRIVDRVGIKSQTSHLIGHGLNIARMRMAYAYHSMASVKVKIVLATVIPNSATETSDYRHIK